MSLLLDYLREVRAAIEKIEIYGYAESVEIKEEIRAGKQAVVKVTVVLVDGSSLYIKEYVDAKYRIEKLSYGYQFQDMQGETIFRYDNAAHKPPLKMKEHKHLFDGRIIEAPAPEMNELVDEVISAL